MRINVIGTSASGKTTFARELAKRIGAPCVEMDQLFWGPNWTESPDEAFFEKLRKALNGDAWVLDGNYSRTLEVKWERVTHVIWLDYSFARTLWQSLRRAFKRSLTREELWPGTGNRESFVRSFFSKDSVVWWMIKTHGKVQKKYFEMMQDPKYRQIKFVHLRSPKEAHTFLEAGYPINII